MNSIIERVALAIWQAREATFPPHTRRMKPDEIDWASGEWARIHLQARAAIGAMREPTQQMVMAGGKPDVYAGADYRWAWKAMVDTALNEGRNHTLDTALLALPDFKPDNQGGA